MRANLDSQISKPYNRISTTYTPHNIMSFVDDIREPDSRNTIESSLGLDLDLETLLRPRDLTVETIVSWFTAAYFYAIAVRLRYEQLGLSEYYLTRPYQRIAYATLIPLTSIFGMRHPIFRLLQYVFYSSRFMYHHVRDYRFANSPVRQVEIQEVVVDTIPAPADGDQAVDVYHDALEY